MNKKTLQEQVRDAFAATGPVAMEKLVTELANRITALESALEHATAPAAD